MGRRRLPSGRSARRPLIANWHYFADVTFAKWRLSTPIERSAVERAVRNLNGHREQSEANCAYRLDFLRDGERAIVRQFTNGTLTLQNVSGSALFEDLQQRIESAVGASSAPTSPRAVAGPDPATVFTTSWIGTDEAGKGDYFGPLVSAAVFVDERTAALLKELGVRDSKTLSDARVRQLARVVWQTVGRTGAAVVQLQPERYNELYEQFRHEGKSLNTLLAWAHARAIEDLLRNGTPTTNVLVDRFTDVEYIRSRLLRQARERSVNLIALPRAEANVAVAAASILARTTFLEWLERTSRELGITLPKGASVAVIQAAHAIVGRDGPERLRQLAKLHFKTSQAVLTRPPA